VFGESHSATVVLRADRRREAILRAVGPGERLRFAGELLHGDDGADDRGDAANFGTSIPARTEPVIDTICGVRCSIIAAPAVLSPVMTVMTLTTPGGRNSAAISANCWARDSLASAMRNSASWRWEGVDRDHHVEKTRRELPLI